MRRFRQKIAEYIGRWRAKRIRTKRIQNTYRTIEQNQARLDNGESI